MFNKVCVKAKIGFDNFIQDQKGVTAVEYAIIGVAVAAVVAGVVGTGDTGLAGAIKGAFDKIVNAVNPTP